MCFCPFSIITAPPTESQAGFGETRPGCLIVGAPGDAPRFPPFTSAIHQRGAWGCEYVHGGIRALSDEGLGCRRALKNLRGFGMRLKVPLGNCDP